MENCPFCDAEVSEELIRFGGACPTCFNAIPGEEAPTDPGLVVVKKESQETTPTKKGEANLVPSLLAGILIIACGLFFLLKDESAQEQLSLETAEESVSSVQTGIREENSSALAVTQEAEAIAEVERLAEAAQIAEAEVQAQAQAAAAAAAERASEAEVVSPSYVDRTPDVSGVGFITEASPDDAYRDPSSYIASVEPSVVTGASAIRRAIRGVISDNSGAWDFCYSQQNDRSLGGTWSVNFVVNEDGSTGDIEIQGQGVSNDGLERCLRGKVHRWVFPAISDATQYSKDYTFSPAL